MAGRRIRRVFRWIGLALAAVIIAFGGTIGILRATNPSPAAESTGWQRKADMPDSRGEVAAALVNGRLVVVGGLHGVGRTSAATTVYDIERDTWTRSEDLPAGRHHAAAAGLDGYVYVSGGAPSATDWTATDSFWRSRPGGRWEELPALPEGRQGHAMVALDGLLYVVGGVGESDRTMVYDPSADRWTMTAALPGGRDHLRAVAWGREVWAIGGRVGNSSQTDVHIFNPSISTWREGPSLPEPMSAMAVGVLSDGLHVVGGEDPRPVRGGVDQAHFVLRTGETAFQARPAALLAVHGAGYGSDGSQLWIAGGASRQGLWSVISYTGVTQAYGTMPSFQTER